VRESSSGPSRCRGTSCAPLRLLPGRAQAASCDPVRPGCSSLKRFCCELADQEKRERRARHSIRTAERPTTPSQENRHARRPYFTHYLVSGLRGAADSDKDLRVTLAEASPTRPAGRRIHSELGRGDTAAPFSSLCSLGTVTWCSLICVRPPRSLHVRRAAGRVRRHHEHRRAAVVFETRRSKRTTASTSPCPAAVTPSICGGRTPSGWPEGDPALGRNDLTARDDFSPQSYPRRLAKKGSLLSCTTSRAQRWGHVGRRSCKGWASWGS